MIVIIRFFNRNQWFLPYRTRAGILYEEEAYGSSSSRSSVTVVVLPVFFMASLSFCNHQYPQVFIPYTLYPLPYLRQKVDIPFKDFKLNIASQLSVIWSRVFRFPLYSFISHQVKSIIRQRDPRNRKSTDLAFLITILEVKYVSDSLLPM